MSSYKILIIDDEEDISELVRYNLSQIEKYEIQCAASGEQGLELARKTKPDLVLLDLMLPGINGLEVCQTLKQRAETRDIRIIMLTAKGEEADILLGFELGADDYITKPFSPKVLIARVDSVLRRSSAITVDVSQVVEVEDLVIDPVRFEVSSNSGKIEITATEFKTLHLLAQNRGRVFTRQNIVHSVHGSNYPVTDRSVDVQIVGLRKKLGKYGDLIETVRGIGYKFKELP
ncbi:response regulator transcription factor [bacterium]|nr:response regulator transcription factor [bacterium]